VETYVLVDELADVVAGVHPAGTADVDGVCCMVAAVRS
jgi:hypothetical protein